MTMPLIEAENLDLEIQVKNRWVQWTQGFSFRLMPGVSTGLLGESGSGKTLTLLALSGLIRFLSTVRAQGTLRLLGTPLTLQAPRQHVTLPWGHGLAYVPQDVGNGLNPFLPVATQLFDVLTRGKQTSRREAERLAVALLERLGIAQAESLIHLFPHQLSMGLQQRVVIALAMACRPKVLVVDEPTSALDVVSGKFVLNELQRLGKEEGTTLLLASHDPVVLKALCSTIVVMHAGQIMEIGPTLEVLEEPRNPFTRALLECLPRKEYGAGNQRPDIPWGAPSAEALPEGCRFHPWCPLATALCQRTRPHLVKTKGSLVACHAVAPSDDAAS